MGGGRRRHDRNVFIRRLRSGPRGHGEIRFYRGQCGSKSAESRPKESSRLRTNFQPGRRLLAIFLLAIGAVAMAAEKNPKNPIMEDAPDGSGRMLVLPLDVKEYLLKEFPNYRIPKDSEYNPEMLQYFNSRLIGVHPSVAWGDFN